MLGWAAAAPVSDRCVYGGVVEHSVDVAPAAHGQGIGRRLLDAFITRCDNTASGPSNPASSPRTPPASPSTSAAGSAPSADANDSANTTDVGATSSSSNTAAAPSAVEPGLPQSVEPNDLAGDPAHATRTAIRRTCARTPQGAAQLMRRLWIAHGLDESEAGPRAPSRPRAGLGPNPSQISLAGGWYLDAPIDVECSDGTPSS